MPVKLNYVVEASQLINIRLKKGLPCNLLRFVSEEICGFVPSRGGPLKLCSFRRCNRIFSTGLQAWPHQAEVY